MLGRLRCIPFLLCPLSLAHAQTAEYPVFEKDKIPAAEYKARRDKVKAALGANGLAVFFTNPVRNRNNDVDYRFRGDSNFLYLTGFEEPDAALVLAPGGFTVNGKKVTEALFTNVSDPMSITWLGYRMGPENAVSLLGIEAAAPNKDFANILFDIKDAQLYRTRIPEGPTDTLATMVTGYTNWSKDKEAKGGLGTLLEEMRAVKSPEELRLIKHAAEASARGHVEVMKSVQPGMWEYDIQAIVEYVFGRWGCESVGYPSIVGSAANSTILHYEEDRRQIEKGDIICMDAAGEYHGYSADVTRSFPASGKFSPEQKAIYEVVLAAQDAGIKECRKGNSFRAPHEAASKTLLEGLKRLGIIQNDSELNRYFMHGTSHTIGLDVHDTRIRTLAPNVVLTVEPGIYIKAGSPCDKKWWNIGIRIEDDILVTDGDPINLSAGAPRTVAEIERTMAKRGIGNISVK